MVDTLAATILRMTTLTSDDGWSAIHSLSMGNREADKIQPSTIAKLIELKFVRIGSSGLPELIDRWLSAGRDALVWPRGYDSKNPSAGWTQHWY
jgi:hypothetical protein